MATTKQPTIEQMQSAVANKAKFLEGSHTPMRLYHGTTAIEGKGKEALRNLKPSKEGALGSGVYLTPNADFAGEYAKKSSGNVLPVHARITNPLVINNHQGEDPMIHALVKLGMTPDKASSMVEKAYEDKGYIGKQVQQRAQAAGHDALMQYRDGNLTEVVHYNPRMIKSATGNRGTYDTTKDDLSMAKGGLAKFLEESKVKDRMYHATHGDFKSFQNNHRGIHFVTPSHEFADDFLTNSGQDDHEKGANIMPVHVHAKNPFDYENKKHVNALATKASLGKLGIDQIKKGDWNRIEDRTTLKAIKDLGHDAVYVNEGGVKNLGVFHPHQIKSAIGNRGTYDPTNPDITMAKGGSVEPKKTVKAYKLFRVHPKHPGKLFPLFVDSNTPVEMNQWVDAKEGEMKNGKVKSKIGDLAYRPGWHAGDLPIATHIGEKSHPSLTAPDRRPANHAWAEVEMPNDVDWQSEATKRGTNAQGRVVPVKAHITDQIPVGGHYRYKTNPNMTGNWLIGGSMKVNKVLSDAEVSRINKDAGLSDLPREQPFKKKEFGFATGGCVAPEEWKAEEHVNYKAKGGMLHLAGGGNVSHNQGATMHPSMAQMRMALAQHGHNPDATNIGVNEAPGMNPKHFFPPDQSNLGMPSPGGVATTSGMPIGGIDANRQQSGQQLMPQSPAPQAPPPGQPPQGSPQGAAPQGPTPPMGNMLSMTPQGQTMGALGGGAPQPPQMAKGGSMSTEDMKREMAQKQADDGTSSRVKIAAEGSGGVKGIVVPRHMWEGKTYKGEGGKKVEGMKHVNAARAEVYGSENREPLTIGQIGSAHKKTLAEHFKRPMEEQTAAEEEALNKLRAAKHIGKNANTLDKSEKLDTVNHETDDQGRNYVGFASKGVAGHSLYTSGQGENMKHHVINTCPGQTVGCGGGADKNGIIDTSKGTCFAPNAEAQYVNAAVRRASHEQAKHDPAMTHDWILAHTGSLRQAANTADKKNKVLLFRPNVVDETDVSSRHAIRHLNEQRKAEDKPPIIANSYGKTNELHDPENGYYVTHSNVGPKVKKGQSIEENISRDKARVRNTVAAADNRGDFKNEQGNLTPPKNSYMVTDVKRGSPMAQNMEKAITHAKYWSTGRHESELSPEELAQGPEGHYGSNHKPTAEENAHYGHRTLNKKRYDYQKQHILHPRLVQVGKNDDGTPHMIPTDSRFKDEEFLPKNRFVSKNGKKAGAILMTTPTESTSNVGHETSFTHHVGPSHIKHALENKGEYEIDKPEEQEKAAGKEYTAPQAIKLPSTMKLAEGGMVSGRHPGLRDDDFHAFPEQNVMAQRHLAMRHGEDEKAETSSLPYHAGHKKAVVVHQSLGAMHLEMLKNKKAK